MPSDPRISAALAAMRQPIADFRALIQSALLQAETFLNEQAAGDAERATRAGIELGSFSSERIDPARFAALFPAVLRVTPAAIAALTKATLTLRALANRGDDLFLVDLPRGGRLGASVGDALAEIGRAFGAAILTDLVRGGRYHPSEHDQLLEPMEFHAWTRTERRFAPPVIVSLDGADLHVGALTDFADGRAKLILVVRGAAAPAPLARCITPGTLVLQTTDGSGLDLVAAYDGPAVAAVMPEGAAVFLHDPATGREPWQRLTVRSQGEVPKRAISGMSAWQMSEDRTLLSDLARTPFAIPVVGGQAATAVGANDALDRIAAWLLEQSGVQGT